MTVVEVECSLWALEDELYRVIEACEELDISLAAYSPLARGFLAGRFKYNHSLSSIRPYPS